MLMKCIHVQKHRVSYYGKGIKTRDDITKTRM